MRKFFSRLLKKGKKSKIMRKKKKMPVGHVELGFSFPTFEEREREREETKSLHTLAHVLFPMLFSRRVLYGVYTIDLRRKEGGKGRGTG